MGMSIEDIATKMRMLAYEIGGSHHSPKEAEKILIELADELSDINVNMSIKLHAVDKQFTGVTENYRNIYLRQENIKENMNDNNGIKADS